MVRENFKRRGRIHKEDLHLLDVRAYLMNDLTKKKLSNKDIAFIFNVHPSQVTRVLNK